MSERAAFSLSLLLAVGLTGSMVAAATGGVEDAAPEASAPVTREADGPVAGTLDISGKWRFRKDPQDIGRAQRWDGISFDDSHWHLTDTAGPWEERGASEYYGAGWYRRWVELGEAWPRVVLVLPRISGRADLFVNGTRADKSLERPHTGTDFIARDITSYTDGKSRFLIALRMVNDKKGQAGGFRNGPMPVMVSRGARALFTGEEGWYDYLGQQYPRHPWPSWMRDSGARWLAVGAPQGAGGGLVGLQGQIAPQGQGFAVSCGLYDPRGKRFYSTEFLKCSLSLSDRVVALPEIDAKAGRSFKMKIRHWTAPLAGEEGMVLGIGEVTVQNTTDRSREVDLVVMVHPFGPAPGPFDIERVSYARDMRVISVNGRPAVVLAGHPTEFGAAPFSESGGVARFLEKGLLPKDQEAVDPDWRKASGAVVYRLRIQPYGARTQTFRVFLEGRPDQMTSELATRIREVGRKSSLDEMQRLWHGLLRGKDTMRLRIRDKAAQDAYYASLSHLFVAAGRIPSFPSPHRDGAVAVAAMLRAGHPGAARRILDPLLGAWSTDDVATGNTSSDVASHAIWALVEYARFTGDDEFLSMAFPAIVRCGRSLEQMHQQQVLAGGVGLPGANAGEAGEGGATWCTAWGVAGWERAAFAAGRLGRETEAIWMRERGSVLRADLEQLLGRKSELLNEPTNLLWPCGVVPTSFPGVREGFGRIWDGWFEKWDGGCRPGGRLLPAAALSLAHNWAFSGETDRVERILTWHLKNQTVPRTYAWARAVDPGTMGHAAGPLPDPRAAAEYICLIRDMLVREEGDSLLLTAGLPASWVKAGDSLEVKQAPTRFGVFPGFSVTVSPRGIYLRIMKSGSEATRVSPPGGIKWRIPGNRSIRQLRVGRARVKEIPGDRAVLIPPGERDVRVVW